jgi:hypothetical protein
MKAINLTFITNLIDFYKSKKYVLNEKLNQVNIIGIRSDSTTSNKFDDIIVVFFKSESGWKGFEYPATTDPGTYYLKNPMNVNGTAILIPGQYKYKIGLHQGKYKALVQRGEVDVLRDYDRNATLDFLNGKKFSGFFGINIHRANPSGASANVDKWSAGCQVFADSNDFNNFLDLVDNSVDLYGNDSIYYVLVDNRSVSRAKKRNITFFFLTLLGIKYFSKIIRK